MIPSMTEGYDCYQHALAERINGILKQTFNLNKNTSIPDVNVYFLDTEYDNLGWDDYFNTFKAFLRIAEERK